MFRLEALSGAGDEVVFVRIVRRRGQSVYDPYGVDAGKYGDDTQTNAVNIANTARLIGVPTTTWLTSCMPWIAVVTARHSIPWKCCGADDVSPSALDNGGTVAQLMHIKPPSVSKATILIMSLPRYRLMTFHWMRRRAALLFAWLITTVRQPELTPATMPLKMANWVLTTVKESNRADGSLIPHEIDFTDTSIWQKLTYDPDAEANVDKVLADSNVILNLTDAVDGKFYVVKPVHIDAPSSLYQYCEQFAVPACSVD